MNKKKVFSVSAYNKAGKVIGSAILPPSKRYLSIGEGLENDLSISIPGVPDKHRLVEISRSRHSLVIPPALDGIIYMPSRLSASAKSAHLIIPPALDGIVYRDNDKNFIHLKALIKRQGINETKGSYIIPFSPGRPFSMRVGDITLSFSYADIPLKTRSANIERSLKKSLVSREDYSFLFLLFLLAAVHFSAAGYLNTIEIKKLEHIDVMAQMPERFAKLIFKPAERKIEKKIAKAKAEEKKEEEVKEEIKKEKKTEIAAAKEPSQKESMDTASSRVKSKGLLGVITAKEKPIFASQNIFDIETEEVSRPKMASVQDARAAGGSSDVVRRLDNIIELDSGDRRPAGRSKDIGDILKEKKVASIILEDEKPKGTETKGGRSEAEVDRVISRYTGGVKYLYNNALRKDPSLKGKITVKLTISERGKVAKVEIASSTVDNKELEDAIMNRIYKWQFSEAIGSGDFVITYTFDFSPTS